MTVQAKEHWQELCEQATKEQDVHKMLGLVAEINRLLDQKHASPKRITAEENRDLNRGDAL